MYTVVVHDPLVWQHCPWPQGLVEQAPPTNWKCGAEHAPRCVAVQLPEELQHAPEVHGLGEHACDA